jgi:hypothetical protein
MTLDSVTFTVRDKDVFVQGFPELDGRKGYMLTDTIASFRGEGWNNLEWYLANIHTGRIRQLSTRGGSVTIEDNDIDYDAINQQCIFGAKNAAQKVLHYGSLSTWDRFKDGFCAISWTLYPNGQYFADSDGYGIRDDEEENVYGIIDENLDFIIPFRPVKNIATLLNEIREQQQIKTILQTMKTKFFKTSDNENIFDEP